MKKAGRQVCGSASCAAIIPAADAKTCAFVYLEIVRLRACLSGNWGNQQGRLALPAPCKKKAEGSQNWIAGRSRRETSLSVEIVAR
jgi:hypothetical protein